MHCLRKCIAFLVYLLLFSSCKKDHQRLPVNTPADEIVITKPHILTPVTVNVNATIGGFYEGVPYDYWENRKSYPLLLFLHGGGQYGNGKNDLPLLLNDGLPQILDEKKFPPVFKVNNESYSFIILTPQFSRYPALEEIKDFFDYALKHYRVDTTRVYLSGLSVGGTVTCDMAAAYSSAFAAIVPISGVSSDNIEKKVAKIADARLPVWIFHNSNDPFINVQSPKAFYASLNALPFLPVPKLTIFFSDKHDAWTKAIDPLYKENGMNIYEWMLQYRN
jgi:poly(3-hydroxybutyrate) depolymerase